MKTDFQNSIQGPAHPCSQDCGLGDLLSTLRTSQIGLRVSFCHNQLSNPSTPLAAWRLSTGPQRAPNCPLPLGREEPLLQKLEMQEV